MDRTPGPDVRARGHGHAADECGPANFPFASPAPPRRSLRVAPPASWTSAPPMRGRRRKLWTTWMLDAAAPPEAREAGMPLEAHKAIMLPADVLGAREPGEDPSKCACTEDVELKMAGFRRFTDDKTDTI
ncbi:hypothetical protein B0H10DRAFT_2428645 [Mycena sp. CBHHK59/15]|nr:hypothetical protein B0H10DRAFT_2428645 [Mycena sp. CBHHK59/15]